ncbi:hypothetical protein BV898_15655 [Hypsibius exemplaris]|uniref:Receptor ligand binding region domain-containing protein n=1 Tax=Hypsibius exemplaris TaxID=2072580 RepID=A0A9X6NI78_HYPEX|nr:hypothetical protein BV898_15655 [Hypsibius exemplaris]
MKWLMFAVIVVMVDAADRHPVINVEIASLGHIYPDNGGCLPYAGPSQDIALQMIQEKYQGTFNFSMRYVFDRKIKSCNELADNVVDLASNWWFKTRNRNSIPALIFPACTDPETFSINQIAAAHNLLMITSIDNQNVIRNKTLSPTFVSVGHYNDGSYFDFYKAIVTTYAWRSVFILIDDATRVTYFSSVGSIAASSLAEIPGQEVTVRHLQRPAATLLQKALQEFRSISRVLLFYGRAEGVRLLLINAFLLNMTNGEYVYITVKNFLNAPLFGHLDWNYGDGDDEIAKKAFPSLLVIRPVDYNDTLPQTSRLNATDISRRALVDYNLTLSVGNLPMPNVIASYLSVEIFAQVLNASLSLYGPASLRDGSHLTRMIINNSFETDVGSIEIDGHGQRTVDLILSYYDVQNQTFTPFVHMSTKSAETRIMRDIIWTKGKPWPPPNRPTCGYNGDSWNCGTKSSIVLPVSLPISLILVGLTAVFIYWIRSGHEHYLTIDHWIIDGRLLLPVIV